MESGILKWSKPLPVLKSARLADKASFFPELGAAGKGIASGRNGIAKKCDICVMEIQVPYRRISQMFRPLWGDEPGSFVWLVLLILLLLGALVSKFLISLSIFLMLPTIFWRWERKETRLVLRKRKLFRDPGTLRTFVPFAWFILFFLVTLLSAFTSSDMSAGLAKVQLRLPYLLLPFVFYANRSMPQTALHFFFWMYTVLTAVVMIGVLGNYALHFDQITETLNHGKSVPTPSNHIRFSLFVAFAALSGVYLLGQQVFAASLRSILMAAAFVLILGLHLLAVRSGLLLFYAGIVYLAVAVWYRRLPRRWLLPVMLLAMLLPFAAYKLLPSLENRINYMVYDLENYFDGNVGSFSDGDRLRSMVVGWELFKRNPWVGCGVGDIEPAAKAMYAEVYEPGTNVRLPHNQLLFFLSTTGLLGTLLTLPAFLLAYFRPKGKHNVLLYLHGIVFLVSCLFEATIEGTNGISFHLLFVLFFLNRSNSLPSGMDARSVNNHVAGS
jgi:O-antigen ligase